ncbi:GNAT family N-acetyltransferase [uncultured Gemmiger sp.]|uniref:GNAT family N-acetyltransferase n=1 Tax=uncultured Gemmiger sp. TaxID=1623490 RepID=UPI0025F7F168|nr:GNAT family N-acetyltransferase [uncultured Gemmiger sp.]
MQVTRQDNRYLLYKESTLIGQAELDGDRITMFTVQPQWRNRGYGSYLLREMLRLNDGFARQTPSHFTAPAPENAAAAALLHKFGFSPTGEADGSWQRVRSPDMTAVELCHRFLEGTIPTGGTFLDATCGNGHDTLFLCRKASPNGRVLALDIQPAAVEATNRLLAEHGLQGVGRAIVCDHRDLGHLVPPGTLDAAVFNFGWLPGADHAVHSAAESTLPALQAALDALKPGGVLTAVLYSGKVIGDGEKQAVLEFFRALPLTKYTVLVCEFANWASTAPLPCFVLKKPFQAGL